MSRYKSTINQLAELNYNTGGRAGILALVCGTMAIIAGAGFYSEIQTDNSNNRINQELKPLALRAGFSAETDAGYDLAIGYYLGDLQLGDCDFGQVGVNVQMLGGRIIDITNFQIETPISPGSSAEPITLNVSNAARLKADLPSMNCH
jgi:hypothetical protein